MLRQRTVSDWRESRRRVMKLVVFAIVAVFAPLVFGKGVSTRWETGTHKHPFGVGLRCPYCDQTWGAFPKGIKAWELRHLQSERHKFYLLHLRLRHKIYR